jgi:hypothetical protein
MPRLQSNLALEMTYISGNDQSIVGEFMTHLKGAKLISII